MYISHARSAAYSPRRDGKYNLPKPIRDKWAVIVHGLQCLRPTRWEGLRFLKRSVLGVFEVQAPGYGLQLQERTIKLDDCWEGRGRNRRGGPGSKLADRQRISHQNYSFTCRCTRLLDYYFLQDLIEKS
jgi:hypothetical protein